VVHPPDAHGAVAGQGQQGTCNDDDAAAAAAAATKSAAAAAVAAATMQNNAETVQIITILSKRELHDAFVVAV
jgi:hypothetical protein